MVKFSAASYTIAVALMSICSVAHAHIRVKNGQFELDSDQVKSMKVGELKALVANKLGVGANDIKLTMNGEELNDREKITKYRINDNSNIDYKFTKEGKEKLDVTGPTYFGVDANDEEAVKQKQRELSEDKFKEMFGEEAHYELDRHTDHHDGPDEKRMGVKDALKWMFNMVKQGLGRKSDEFITTEAPESQ